MPSHSLTWLKTWVMMLAIILGITFVASWPLAFYRVKDAQFIQIIVPAPAEASVLFGESGPGTPIGKADYYLIPDPKAFLEGKSEEGALLVSETYLKEHQIYPWQSRTIWFIQNVVAWISGLGGLLLIGLWFLIHTRASKGF
jgi:hypothetical protein